MKKYTQISAAPIDASDKATTRAASNRTMYSGNDIMRIMNALKSAKLDMDDKRFSMNGVIHVVQEEIESLMQSHNCSYAEIAQIFASTGCPVSERTLKDYLFRARKDARAGRTGYSRIRKLIIESAESAAASEASVSEPADPASTAPESPDSFDMLTPDCGFLEKSVSEAMDANEAADRKRQHVIETAEPAESKPAEPAIAGQAGPASTAEDCIPAVSLNPVIQEAPCAAPESPDFDDMPAPDNGFLEKSVSEAMDANEAADRKRQHIQAIYDARKRRKKARQSKKKVQAA